MFFDFYENEYVDEILDLIKDYEYFTVNENHELNIGFIKYLYLVHNGFGNLEETDLNTLSMLRETRGLIFDLTTKKIISRRYHKFFNLNEFHDTLIENIDFSQNYYQLEKLDGSMVSPLYINNILYWATKSGVFDEFNDAVNDFISDKQYYVDFCLYMIKDNYTPIFEYISVDKNKIVIQYENDRLVLTGIRHNYTGEYLSYEEMTEFGNLYNIEVVRSFNYTSNYDSEYVERLVKLEKVEGEVFRFTNGHMIKLKTNWYRELNSFFDVNKFEKNVLYIFFHEMVDDLMPILKNDESSKILKYYDDVSTNINSIVNDCYEKVKEDFGNMSKKDFVQKHKSFKFKNIMFQSWDILVMKQSLTRDDVYDAFTNYCKRKLGSQTYIDQIRHYIGPNWTDYN